MQFWAPICCVDCQSQWRFSIDCKRWSKLEALLCLRRRSRGWKRTRRAIFGSVVATTTMSVLPTRSNNLWPREAFNCCTRVTSCWWFANTVANINSSRHISPFFNAQNDFLKKKNFRESKSNNKHYWCRFQTNIKFSFINN